MTIAQTHKDAAFVIRPVKAADLNGLLNLAELSGPGFSSLQPDRKFLAKYIQASVSAFSNPTQGPQKFLLVLISPDQKVIGCSAVKTGVGLDQPFVNFDLSGTGETQYMEASNRFDGATEVGSLFLHPDYRALGLGRYLAKVRYLLMASAPEVFSPLVIAELRGIPDKDGSIFFNYFFRDRLECSYTEADIKYAASTPEELALISPIGKISTEELPLEVREVIGHPHPEGRGAFNLLMDEGFLFSGSVDLFDGGPIVSVHRDTIKTTRDSRLMTVQSESHTSKDRVMVCSTALSHFRAVVAPGTVTEGEVRVLQNALQAAKFVAGQNVRVWCKNGAQLSVDTPSEAEAEHV